MESKGGKKEKKKKSYAYTISSWNNQRAVKWLNGLLHVKDAAPASNLLDNLSFGGGKKKKKKLVVSPRSLSLSPPSSLSSTGDKRGWKSATLNSCLIYNLRALAKRIKNSAPSALINHGLIVNLSELDSIVVSMARPLFHINWCSAGKYDSGWWNTAIIMSWHFNYMYFHSGKQHYESVTFGCSAFGQKQMSAPE